MVLTEKQDTSFYPAATMETAQATTEEALYANLPETRTAISTIAGYPTDSTTSPNNEVAEVSGNGQKIGPSITLKVMAGDHFNIKVSSWYQTNGADPQSPNSSLTDLVAALINGLSGPAGAAHGNITAAGLQNSGVITPGVTDFLNNNEPNAGTKPRAYLNWILFDEQFKMVAASSGAEQVGDDGEFTQHVKTNLPVTKNGYLYVYVSNETPNIDVFFDNLQVTHIHGQILEETHYYPFGLTMAGISDKAAGGLENRYKYNGIELDTSLGLDEYEATLRDLDPQTGRWWQVDPETEHQEMWSPYTSNNDNPILYKDPRGNEGEECCGGFIEAIKKSYGEAKALVLGAANAWGSDQVLGAGNKSAEEAGFTGDEATFYDAGQTTGHGVAIITGASESVVGGGSEVLTVGGSTPVSIPLALHGASTISTAFSKLLFAEHKKNARPSTVQPHQEGKARKKQDRQGSKGMTEAPRKRPPNHRGPWPPKPTPPKPVEPPPTPQKPESK